MRPTSSSRAPWPRRRTRRGSRNCSRCRGKSRKFGQDGEAAALQRKFLAPLKDKVLRAIEDVAKKEKLNFIFDKIEEASLLLWADAKYDYTNLVLDYLKRGSN
jgi:hypothetical protein